MFKQMACLVLGSLACVLVFAPTATADNLTISQPARIAKGPAIKPGRYQIKVLKSQDAAEVSFFQQGDLVVTVPATLVKESKKCKSTEIHTNDVDGEQVIVKIWLEGSTESLVFGQDKPKAD